MLVRLTHTRMQIAISFVSGLMLGVGVLHMLPHAFEAASAGSTHRIAIWLLFGMMTMFFVERFFSFHHHDIPEEEHDEGTGHVCDHEHGHNHELSWSGAAIGLTLHSVLAGVALAVSVKSEGPVSSQNWLPGLATFLVIFLHKPFDAMMISTLMTAGEWSKRSRHLINGLFSLAIPLGVILFFSSEDLQSGNQMAYALAFSAGMFLCISLSDLLPELQFHQHDRVKLSAALLLGIGLAWGVGLLEHRGHDHQHDHDHASHAHEEETPEARSAETQKLDPRLRGDDV